MRVEPWPEGTPNWVDLATSDPAAASAFYSALFGWEIRDTGEETGRHRLCLLRGRAAAGIARPMPGVPTIPFWTTYIAVGDAAEAARAIAANGGKVLMAPARLGEESRVAYAEDPTGAFFGLWQAQQFIGEQVANEPGAVVWNECMTGDAPRAREFYSAVFGYTYCRIDGAGDYTSIDGAGRWNTVGGVGGLEPVFAMQTPAHWMTYFQVAEADAAATATESAGGQVLAAPFDAPFGRMAVLLDPQGALFSVVQDTSGLDEGERWPSR